MNIDQIENWIVGDDGGCHTAYLIYRLCGNTVRI